MSASHNHYYRVPKTTQERRRNFEDKEFIRGKRSDKNLPDAWDDIPICHRNNKSWKSRRGNQYLDADCKLFHLEIRSASGLTTYQNLARIERELEHLDFSYNRQYKILNEESFYLISYRGKSIGNWDGVKYL